jgi:hypothetical protein
MAFNAELVRIGIRAPIPAALSTLADGSQSLQNACAVHQRDGHPSASKTATGSR